MTRLYDYQTWHRHIFGENDEVCKGLWAFFLDCALRMLIGWKANSNHMGPSENVPLYFMYFISQTLALTSPHTSKFNKSLYKFPL